MNITELIDRVASELEPHPGGHSDWLLSVSATFAEDPPQAYAMLNSRRMWGGAGSVASEALADNPGMDEVSWERHIREFRSLMIELAEHLKARGNAYPDIDFWLSAYTSWNQSL